MAADRGRRGALRSVSAPKQRRSEATLTRILEAAERLICRDGLAALSIAALVREAKSSVGGFYARFKDKDELLRALHEQQLSDIRDFLGSVVDPERWEGVDLRTMLNALLNAYRLRTAGRRRLMAAFLEASARNPEAWAQAIAFRQEIIESTAHLLLLRREEIRHVDPEFAVRFTIQQAFALDDVRSLYAHTPAMKDDFDDKVFARETARSMYAYLTLSES